MAKERVSGKRLAPKDVLCLRGVLKLKETTATTRLSWLHLGHDGLIHIVNQRNGQNLTGNVKLTRAEFEKFVRFYNAGQTVKP